MTITHAHPHNLETLNSRQDYIDHMVTVHCISPTHFRDKPTYDEVRAVHTMQHEQRSGEDRRDRVEHPEHYNSHPSGVECIDVIEHMTLNAGNAVKYLWRAGLKDGSPEIEDLKKARWYIDREIKRLEKVDGQPGGHAERRPPQDPGRRRPVRDSPQA
jgi:hypothetical protein